MQKKQRRRPNYLIILIIIIILGFIIWNLHSSWLVGQLSLETVRQGWVKHEKTVKTVYANTEVILTAPAEGRVTFKQEDGKRIKKGEAAAIITPTGVDQAVNKKDVSVPAPISGLFYSLRDGLEEIVTPENLMNMDLEALLGQTEGTGQQPVISDDIPISKHTPIGKMLNNLYPSWMFVYLDSSDRVAKGNTVKFIVEEEEYTGTVMKVSGKPRGAVIRFSQYVKGTTEDRMKDVIWVCKPPSKGLVVPVSSLWDYGEERGVYIVEDGVVRFRNIKVKDSNESLACIVGVPEGVKVITNPRKGIEGLFIR